jgi:hypothetical protein
LSRNSGASTSRNPKGLSRPVAGKLKKVRTITTKIKSQTSAKSRKVTYKSECHKETKIKKEANL